MCSFKSRSLTLRSLSPGVPLQSNMRHKQDAGIVQPQAATRDTELRLKPTQCQSGYASCALLYKTRTRPSCANGTVPSRALDQAASCLDGRRRRLRSKLRRRARGRSTLEKAPAAVSIASIKVLRTTLRTHQAAEEKALSGQ